jgi:hypothetical protein
MPGLARITIGDQTWVRKDEVDRLQAQNDRLQAAHVDLDGRLLICRPHAGRYCCLPVRIGPSDSKPGTLNRSLAD